jgi:hypothetical protein
MPDKPPNELTVSVESVPESTVIWRYFSFERFRDILKTQSLWFSRPFGFEDQWEGLFPPSYLKRTRQYATANNIPFKEFDQDFRKRFLRHRCAHFVNCWHISDHESDAMWKLYALAPKGIAFQSTVGDVKECLRPHNSGRVIYYDPSHDVRSPTIFGPHEILFKRTSFSWEQEYRFWFDDDELLQKIEAGEHFREKCLSRGRSVGITDMRRFIKKIVVAPGASDGFIKRVRAACAKHRRRRLWNVIERSYSDRMWDSFTT